MTTSTVQACARARCGTPFIRILAPGHASRVYCSRRCAERVAQRARRDRQRAARPPVACAVCGRAFTAARAGMRYCGPECRNRRRRPPRQFAPRRCMTCGQPFTPTWRKQAYCSLAHRRQSVGSTRHGGVQAPAVRPSDPRPPRSTEASGTPAVSPGGRGPTHPIGGPA